MNYIAEIDVMPLKEILDPQGKAIKLGLGNLGVTAVSDVRMGKHIVLNIRADSEEAARQIVENACQKLLANLIMEDYHYRLFKED